MSFYSRKFFIRVLFSGVQIAVCGGCSHGFRHLEQRRERVEVSIPASQSEMTPDRATDSMGISHDGPVAFTTAQGEQLMLVPVAYDEQTHEAVLQMQIEQVTISVRNMRNLAERNGKIDMEFMVTVPETMSRSQWRVRLQPMMCMGPDTVQLSSMVFSGERFRQKQLEDYNRYKRYLGRIVDSADYFEIFGDITAFEEYLQQVAAQRNVLLGKKRRLEKLTPREAADDSEVATFDSEVYRRGLRQLTRYADRMERTVRRTTIGVDASDKNARLENYLAPRYTFGNRNPKEDAVVCYRRGANPEERAEYYMRGTGTGGDYERSMLEALSDSSYRQHYRIGMRAIDTDLRLLTGIDTAEAMRRYYDRRLIERNERLALDKEAVYNKTVRFPRLSGVRIDTLVQAGHSITYRYAEQIDANENTSKIYLFLLGDVTAINGRAYHFPPSDTLTYSVTSMTSFVDPTPRYVRRIVLRDAEANARFFFMFRKSRAVLDEQLADNRGQLAQVRKLTCELMTDPVFIIDSITLTATSSPEGARRINEQLARDRATELKRVLDEQFRLMQDSLAISAGFEFGSDGSVRRVAVEESLPDLPSRLRAISKIAGREELRQLIAADPKVPDAEAVLAALDAADPVRWEAQLRRHGKAYDYIREKLYPQLRAVDFRFRLRRRGMRQDTVWTTELDSAYMRGVELLHKRRYEEALTLLRPYEDRNTALAYLSVGLDRAACRILQQEDTRRGDDPDTKYMLSVAAARLGDDQTAVTSLLRAVELRPRLRFRANLDPELAELVRRYGLFNDDNSNLGYDK